MFQHRELFVFVVYLYRHSLSESSAALPWGREQLALIKKSFFVEENEASAFLNQLHLRTMINTRYGSEALVTPKFLHLC